MLWDKLLKLYKTLLSESLMIRQTTVEVTKTEGITKEEVTIKVEAITNFGNNAQNDNVDINNGYNSGNFGGGARSCGEFAYTTKSRVASTKAHNIHQIPNPTTHDTMARIELDSHTDTNCAGKDMTILSYIGYNCNIIVFHYELKQMENIPLVTAVTAYDDSLSGNTVMLLFNQELWFGSIMGQYLIATNPFRSH